MRVTGSLKVPNSNQGLYIMQNTMVLAADEKNKELGEKNLSGEEKWRKLNQNTKKFQYTIVTPL